MPDIQLGFTASTAFVLLLVFIAIGAAVLFYRYTLPPIPPRTRLLLSVLRSISLSLLLLLLLKPLLRLVTTRVEPPLLAVLIDNSRSMSIVDRTGSRETRLQTLLRSNGPGSLGATPGIRYFTFGQRFRAQTREELETSSQNDSAFVSEESTNIASALQQLGELRETEPFRAALLITDGSYTEGINPLYPAEGLGIPVSTIGIGDTLEQRDLVVLRVTTNDLVYAETEVPVEVTLRSAGFDHERVDVTLSDGRSILSHREIDLLPGTREYVARLSYTPTGAGTRKYQVRVSTLPDELTADNNRRNFFVKILKSKLRVLMIAGAPDPDVAILKQTLNEDPNIVAQSFSQNSDGGWYEGRFTKGVLDSADCLVTLGFPTGKTSDALMQEIRGAVVENDLPLFFLWGAGIDSRRLGDLSSTLPFSVTSISAATRYVFPEPVQAMSANPIIALDDAARIDRWRKLPPIFQTEMELRAKAEARTVAVCRIQNVVTQEPLILLRHVGGKKSIAVTGYGLWRWRLMAQGSTDTDDLLSLFLSNSVRWLTTREDDRRVNISPERQTFLQGDPVVFSGQVYDATARPVPDARVKVMISGEKREFEVTLHPAGNGLYHGAIEGLPSGDYTYRGTAQRDNASLGEDNGRFVVGERNVEFQETTMNVNLLRQIAARTGGFFGTPDSLASVIARMRSGPTFTSTTSHTTSDHELWNWPYTLAVIVVLLGAEWIIRKRNGML